MPRLPDGIFEVQTPSGGLHVPFKQTDASRALGNVRNVTILAPTEKNSRRTIPVCEFEGVGHPWCAPWQRRKDGGQYVPVGETNPTKALPIWDGLPAKWITWIDENSRAHTGAEIKGEFEGFHDDNTLERFLEHNQCTEDKATSRTVACG